MIAASAQHLTNAPGWVVPACLAVGIASWILRSILPRALARGVFIVAVSAAVALLIDILAPMHVGAMQQIARTCAALSLLWSVVGSIGARPAPPVASSTPASDSMAPVAMVVALLLGVVAAIVQTVVLVMRVIFMVVDLLHGYPSEGVPAYGFGAEGLWSIGCLLGACLVSLSVLKDRRLAACTWWCAMLATSWAILLLSPLRATPVGGYERTGHTVYLALALSVLMALFVGVSGQADRRRRWRQTMEHPEELAQPTPHWPGLSITTVLLGLVLILLVCYHLAVPIALGSGGFRAATLLATSAAWIAAITTFVVARREWSVSAADTGMGLASLGLCGVVLLFVPAQPETLTERYPLIFNAMMGGLALATGLWIWLARFWAQQLDHRSAWTTAGRLVPVARHFAFLTASLALVLGAVMAVWPRLPGISVTDDSLGRVCAGVAVNLFLLLVMLWSSRHVHKFTFQILTVLAVASTAGFLMARMMPFTPQFG